MHTSINNPICKRCKSKLCEVIPDANVPQGCGSYRTDYSHEYGTMTTEEAEAQDRKWDTANKIIVIILAAIVLIVAGFILYCVATSAIAALAVLTIILFFKAKMG